MREIIAIESEGNKNGDIVMHIHKICYLSDASAIKNNQLNKFFRMKG